MCRMQTVLIYLSVITLHLFMLPSLIAAPNTTIQVQPEFKHINASPLVDYYADTSASLTFEQVRSLPNNVWIRSEDSSLSFGFTSDAYWVRLTIESNGMPLLLHADYATFDDLTVFIASENKPATILRGGFKIAPNLSLIHI